MLLLPLGRVYAMLEMLFLVKILGNFCIEDGQHCAAWMHFVPCSLALNYEPAGQQICSVHIALPHN